MTNCNPKDCKRCPLCTEERMENYEPQNTPFDQLSWVGEVMATGLLALALCVVVGATVGYLVG